MARTEGGQFAPGHSGNPEGKKPGTRNLTTRAVEALLDGEAEALTRVAVEKALDGDVRSLRLCLDRIAPTRKDGPVSFDLPPIQSAADAKAASSAVLAAVASGEITPGEGQAVMSLLVSHKVIVEATDFEERISVLEAKQ